MVQQASAESYWYNQLSAAALARVDAKGQAARDAYLADVAGTNQPGLQGSLTSAQVLANADVASSVVDRLASQSAPILNMYGEPLQSGGQSLTAFNATAEQRANSYLLNTPVAEAENRVIANANRATLSYLGAVNGGAERDYTAEEFLLGGAIGGKAVEAIAGVLELGATVTATRSPIRTGSYEGATVTVDDARAVFKEVELPTKPGRCVVSRKPLGPILRQNRPAPLIDKTKPPKPYQSAVWTLSNFLTIKDVAKRVSLI